MTTIVVHGTLAAADNWYWNSWHKGGFCQSLADAMINSSGKHDVWRLNNTPVEEIPELNPKGSFWTGRIGQIHQREGHFFWTGDYQAVSRKMGGNDLVKYLNVIAHITNEPIRIIAHSHGCNIVKHASSSDKLDPKLFFESAVFLACPHMTEADSGKILYPLNPTKFGRIGNFYSERDPVVGKIAGSLATVSGWKYEIPEAFYCDPDPRCEGLYENYNMQVPDQISGTAVHSWLHGPEMAYAAGEWLETGTF